MDILTHTLSGIAVSSVVASVTNLNLKSKFFLIGTGGLAAALPDTDTLSLWSGFDGTFGDLFYLSLSGKEIYFGKQWYSHHGFMHSLAAAGLFSLLFMATIRLFKKNKPRIWIFGVAFFLSYVAHLAGDLPTPGSAWGGISFFWPSGQYIGGSGKIWWWNNYDIFLVLFLFVTVNAVFMMFNKFQKIKLKIISPLLFLLTLVIILYQVNTRPFDFSYSGHTPHYSRYEQQSLNFQREMLGEDLYRIMKKLDNEIPFYF